MTFEQLSAGIKDKLQKAEIESAAYEANEIVKFYGGRRFCEVTGETVSAAFSAADLRVGGKPLQYIFGEWEFFGLPFKVGPGVLIPRADTETAVECALRLLKGKKEPTVADLCAGSGCIGIALAASAGARVTFVEKSAAATEYLKENLSLNGVNGRVIEGDVLKETNEFSDEFDLFISNPPYIRTDDIKTLSDEVKAEPLMALDGGGDGLLFYKKIAALWKNALKNGGYAVFEIGYDQKEDVGKILQSEGFCGITCVKDLCGNDRVVYAKYIKKEY